MNRRLLPLAVACLAALAPGQAIIVDDDGGPGVHYTDLTQAVAEAPSGAVLRVRPGLYTGVFFGNKGVSIIGDDASTVIVNSAGPLRIGPTQLGQDVLMTDLTFRGIGPGPAGIEIDGAAGEVVLDSVVIELSSGSGLVIRNCANAHLRRCTIQRPSSAGRGCCDAPAELIRSSVQVSDCTFLGVDGSISGLGHGAPGLLIEDESSVFMTRTTALGGDGASFTCRFTCFWGGFGGQGVQCWQSTLIAESCELRGGWGGTAMLTAPPGFGVWADGSRIEIEGFALDEEEPWPSSPNTVYARHGSILSQNPDSEPALARAGAVQPGATTDLTLTAQNGSAAVLLLGFDAVYAPLTQSFATGVLLVLPAFSAGVGAVPESGTLQVPLPISPLWPRDTAIHGQFATLEPASGRVWASNAFLLLAKS